MNKIIHDDVVDENILNSAEEEMRARFDDLIKAVRENDSDIIGVKELLYKNNYKYFDAFKNDILQRMQVNYKIEIASIT